MSDHITEPLGLASIALAIVVPLILGPLAATFLHIGLSLVGFVRRSGQSDSCKLRNSLQTRQQFRIVRRTWQHRAAEPGLPRPAEFGVPPYLHH